MTIGRRRAALDLTFDDIRTYAQDPTNGGIRFTDIRSLMPAVRARVQPEAAFTTVQVNSTSIVIYNMANFWQTQYRHMIGTVLHEFAPAKDPFLLDTEIQAELGLTVNPTDTTNISRKLGDDCFPNIANPAN